MHSLPMTLGHAQPRLHMVAGAVLDHVPFIYLGFVNCQRFTQCAILYWALTLGSDCGLRTHTC